MDAEERQLLLTCAWLFVRHGQASRARTLIEALIEEDPRDGVAAVALAELMLSQGEPREALRVLRAADFPEELGRAEAILETRALKAIGKVKEGNMRWKRFVESKKGDKRSWIS